MRGMLDCAVASMLRNLRCISVEKGSMIIGGVLPAGERQKPPPVNGEYVRRFRRGQFLRVTWSDWSRHGQNPIHSCIDEYSGDRRPDTRRYPPPQCGFATGAHGCVILFGVRNCEGICA